MNPEISVPRQPYVVDGGFDLHDDTEQQVCRVEDKHGELVAVFTSREEAEGYVALVERFGGTS